MKPKSCSKPSYCFQHIKTVTSSSFISTISTPAIVSDCQDSYSIMKYVYRVLLAPSYLFGVVAVVGLLYVSFYSTLRHFRTLLTNLQVTRPLHS